MDIQLGSRSLTLDNEMIKSTQIKLCLCILSCSLPGIIGQLGRPYGRIRDPVLLPSIGTVGSAIGHPQSLVPPGKIAHHHGEAVIGPHVDPAFTHGNKLPVPAINGHLPHAPSKVVVDQQVLPPLTHGNNLPVPVVHTRTVVDEHLPLVPGPVAVDKHVDHPFPHGIKSPVPVIHSDTVGHPHELNVVDLKPIVIRPKGLGRRGRGRRGRRRGRNWRRRNGRGWKRGMPKGLRRIVGRDFK